MDQIFFLNQWGQGSISWEEGALLHALGCREHSQWTENYLQFIEEWDQHFEGNRERGWKLVSRTEG